MAFLKEVDLTTILTLRIFTIDLWAKPRRRRHFRGWENSSNLLMSWESHRRNWHWRGWLKTLMYRRLLLVRRVLSSLNKLSRRCNIRNYSLRKYKSVLMRCLILRLKGKWIWRLSNLKNPEELNSCNDLFLSLCYYYPRLIYFLRSFREKLLFSHTKA